MSVVTTADEKLEETKEHLEQAKMLLSEILITKCWGSDEYSQEYQEKMMSLFLYLVSEPLS